MSRVLLDQVTKLYDKNVVGVDNVTFEVMDKEFFVLVGPSGCGKSTTLRLIAGLEEPTEGKIFIGDRLVNGVPPKDRDIAMVFQNYALYPHMTAFDNMAFGLKMRKFPKAEIEKRVREAAKILNITHLLDRKPKALSGGERQRVALGRAIVRSPKVFLFDEPLSNLDAKLRVQMRAELAQLQKRLNTTVCYVTHDQVEAMTLGERIGVMKDGKILQIADAMTLYDKPVNKFVAGFLGSPPMNFIEGVIKNEPKMLFDSNGLSFPIPPKILERLGMYVNQPVIMGIRPEAILLQDQGRNLPEFSASVAMTEPMGSETIVYLLVGTNRLIVRTPIRYQPSPMENINCYLDTEKLHFFNKITEQAI
uniref:sn-glycerol-3-phosphate ABC transporter ATP-binding protein UgpC n=1 Tax=candidate division WOR-3 bacterium TaxID=2052148 RepID=A0A7C6EAH0_UNCW3